jgi:hypothetical protein
MGSLLPSRGSSVRMIICELLYRRAQAMLSDAQRIDRLQGNQPP